MSMGADTPVPTHVTALETALSLAHAALRTLDEAPASTFDLRPAGGSLVDAIAAITTGYDESFDPLLSVRSASVALASAKAEVERAVTVDPPLAEVATWLGGAIDWLRIVEQRHARVPPSPVPFGDLLATSDALRLHHLPRATLRPCAAIPAPKPAPHTPSPATPKLAPAKSFAELDARLEKLRAGAAEQRAARPAPRPRASDDAPAPAPERAPEIDRPGYAPGPHAAVGVERALADKARECAEEVGMLGLQRAPLLGDPWRSAAIFESRMFAAIDAFASLGSGGIGSLERTLADAPAKDATRVFAALLLGGCFVGRDALAMGERVARKIGLGEADARAAAVSALALVPHRGLHPMLLAWSTDADPGARAVAIEVLRSRGLATPEDALRAARDPHAWVRAAGLAAAADLRVDDLDALVAEALESEEALLRDAAYVAGLVGDVPYVADKIQADLGSAFEDRAIVALAIGGTDQRHADAVVARLEVGLTPPRVFAAGWCGSTAAIPHLLEGLKGSKLDVALGCAFALERITGASLAERLDVPPEALDAPGDVADPDIGDAPPKRSLARQVSDPRDLPSDGSPDRVVAPTIREDRWKAWLAREDKRFRAGVRYRRGAPYTAAVSFTELDRFPLTPAERRWLHRELVVRTGQLVRFDTNDLVPVQEQSLAAWAPHAERASSLGGSFGRARRARR